MRIVAIAAIALLAAGHAPRHHRRPGQRSRPAPSAVSVHAREYALTLSRPLVHAGTVVVELDNRGEDPHDLRLARVAADGQTTGAPALGFGPLSSHRIATQKLTLTPGTWRLWCSLPGHDARGMHATLTVARRR